MCGICGVMALEGPLDPTLRAAVRAMNGAIAYRGPDGDGFHDGAQATLGHRRLAIIDRAGGAQPMGNEDGTCWIVFNGEVYNHRGLRPVLEGRGHRFRTVSDTEAILHAWEEYGTSCVDHLEGMFAFAIYDERRRELFIARDRLGKKPLFYGTFGGVFHFASELGALRASPVWPGTLDLSALEGYLSLGYFLAPHTAYRDVQKLEPGCWLHVANGGVTTSRYWDVTEFGTDSRDDQALVADVEATLRAAVHERLESEVPLGAFLSGGIDSGLIVSFMAEALGDRVVTATVGFADAAHNELDAAGLTAAHFATQHHAQIIEPRLDEVFDTVVDHMGEPMADSSAIPTWYVSGAARRHVTVALSGDGGTRHSRATISVTSPTRGRGRRDDWCLAPRAGASPGGSARHGRAAPACRVCCGSGRSSTTCLGIPRRPTTWISASSSRPRRVPCSGCRHVTTCPTAPSTMPSPSRTVAARPRSRFSGRSTPTSRSTCRTIRW